MKLSEPLAITINLVIIKKEPNPQLFSFEPIARIDRVLKVKVIIDNVMILEEKMVSSDKGPNARCYSRCIY